MDHLTVRVEARGRDLRAAPRGGGRAESSRAVKDGVGVTVDMQVVDPGTLERSAGQAAPA